MIKKFVVIAFTVVGLQVVGMNVDQAHACRPIATNPDGVQFCNDLLQNRPPKYGPHWKKSKGRSAFHSHAIHWR